jgi:hypothetical protein
MPIEVSGERLRLRTDRGVLELERVLWIVMPRSTPHRARSPGADVQ